MIYEDAHDSYEIKSYNGRFMELEYKTAISVLGNADVM